LNFTKILAKTHKDFPQLVTHGLNVLAPDSRVPVSIGAGQAEVEMLGQFLTVINILAESCPPVYWDCHQFAKGLGQSDPPAPLRPQEGGRL